MRRGKYQNKRTSKVAVILLVLVLLLGCTVGGTLAWLYSTSTTVTNTFVAGDIGTLKIEETDPDKTYVIIPGVEITKDPKITYTLAANNNVSAYIFVKVEGGNWSYDADKKTYSCEGLSWSVDTDNWTQVENMNNVFYYSGNQATDGKVTVALSNIPFIADNTITVADTITKGQDMTDAVNAATGLKFTAYAIQSDGFSSITDAWNAVKDVAPGTNAANP